MGQDWNDLTHFYWGRKPIAGIKTYIEEHTKEGDVIFDPFCGAGTVVIEALKRNRRIVALDINPMATFLTKITAKPISLYLLRNEFEKIENDISRKILKMYNIKCPECNKEAVIHSTIWTTVDGQSIPSKIRIRCRFCSSDKVYEVSNSEKERQLSKQDIEIPYWYPKSEIKTKLRKPPARHFYELFTKRNLFCLSLLFDRINKIPERDVKEAFFCIFTDMLYACSRMQMYSPTNPKRLRGWAAPRLYIPNRYNQERNVWNVFKSRYIRFCKAKEILNSAIYKADFAVSIEDFVVNRKDALILTCNSTNFKVPDKLKFNYVYIDPPFREDI
ncbi:MAG: DNA methyltransferase, partial [Candidatus Thermoplasmatota archaeon]